MSNEAGSAGGVSFWPFAWIRRLYDWVLSFGKRPDGARALFLVAFAESSFFPIPPDFLLIPLAIGAPGRALWFATLTTAGSVLGGVLGYLLGYQFYEAVGRRIIAFYGIEQGYGEVRLLYQQWDALAVAVAGFTPIPFKVFTIAAGVFGISFPTFVLAAALSRGARFFILGGLIRWQGGRIQQFIDRYFNLLTVVVTLLLVGGFLVLRYII